MKPSSVEVFKFGKKLTKKEMVALYKAGKELGFPFKKPSSNRGVLKMSLLVIAWIGMFPGHQDCSNYDECMGNCNDGSTDHNSCLRAIAFAIKDTHE